MTYAVTGATGKIGSEVVRLLREAGEPVRVLVRDEAKARERLPDGVETVTGDLTDARAVVPFLDGADGLFVVSADPTTEDVVVREAGRRAVPHVVLSSAIGFGHEAPPGHREIERTLADQPVSWTVLRPSAFMQTLADYLPRLVDDGEFALPAGTGASAWVDTRDIAAVAAAVLRDGPGTHGGQTYLVTGPEALTMAAVADVVAEASGVEMRYRPVDPATGLERMTRAVGPLAQFLSGHYEAVARGGFAEVTDTVQQVAGRPATTLAQFVSEDPGRWRPQG